MLEALLPVFENILSGGLLPSIILAILKMLALLPAPALVLLSFAVLAFVIRILTL